MTNHPLVLASTSPRRRLLLQEAGITFTAISPNLDDGVLTPGSKTPPHHWVTALAHLKASAGAAILRDHPPSRVLGSDTVVEHQGLLMGQPTDIDHAAQMIRALSNATHRVLTGVAIIEPQGPPTWLVDAAVVTVGTITPAQIDDYLSTDTWRGKAGGYNLSERLNAGWPITVVGDPATVMGLPIRRLLPILSRP